MYNINKSQFTSWNMYCLSLNLFSLREKIFVISRSSIMARQTIGRKAFFLSWMRSCTKKTFKRWWKRDIPGLLATIVSLVTYHIHSFRKKKYEEMAISSNCYLILIYIWSKLLNVYRSTILWIQSFSMARGYHMPMCGFKVTHPYSFLHWKFRGGVGKYMDVEAIRKPSK